MKRTTKKPNKQTIKHTHVYNTQWQRITRIAAENETLDKKNLLTTNKPLDHFEVSKVAIAFTFYAKIRKFFFRIFCCCLHHCSKTLNNANAKH